MTTKKKKSAKQRRVLIVALIVAAAIVAGSTFAWFASKDEVTNRLTASANYNVAIVEDFQAPADWIPGQTINKDVSAVNAGNVDAFVRMWLGGQMRLLKQVTATDEMVNVSTLNTALAVDAVDDESKTKLGLNYSATANGKTTYYKTLSTKKIENPLDANHAVAATDSTHEETNSPAAFSEVQAMQAAGVLVYAPTNASYTWTLEQAADLWVLGSPNTLTHLAKGTEVGSISSSATTKIAPSQSGTTGNYYGAIDASTFKPQTTGLYLFRRTIFETLDGTENQYEYSGYYYDAGVNGGTYFALYTGGDTTGANGNSDYVLPAGVIDDKSTSTPSKDQVLPVAIAGGQAVYLYTATETLVNHNNNEFTWAYDGTTGNEKFTVTYNDGGKPIVIEIALANIGTTADKWTAIGKSNSPDQTTTFYYTNDLEAGDTTVKLVDSVKLADATQVGAYLAFDFDLDVFMESVQVTMDEAGNEGYGSVTSWAATAPSAENPKSPNIGATGKDNNSFTRTPESEITCIAWTAAT